MHMVAKEVPRSTWSSHRFVRPASSLRGYFIILRIHLIDAGGASFWEYLLVVECISEASMHLAALRLGVD